MNAIQTLSVGAVGRVVIVNREDAERVYQPTKASKTRLLVALAKTVAIERRCVRLTTYDLDEYPYALWDNDDCLIELLKRREVVKWLDIYSLACIRLTGRRLIVTNETDIDLSECPFCEVFAPVKEGDE